jgi:hypothetical protein
VTYAALGPDAALLCDNDLTCSCSFFFFLFSFFLNASDHRLDPKSERKTKEAEVNKAKRNKTKPSVAETAKNARIAAKLKAGIAVVAPVSPNRALLVRRPAWCRHVETCYVLERQCSFLDMYCFCFARVRRRRTFD